MAYFQKIAMVPNDSDAPVLARRGGAERHEESDNGAFPTKAMAGSISGTVLVE